MTESKLALLEALLFVAGEPVAEAQIAEVLQLSGEETKAVIRELGEKYEKESTAGIMLEVIHGEYRLCTKPQYGQLLKERYADPMSLSSAALETLAVVAFKAPVTKAEIERLRGVGCDRSLATLMEKELVMECGRAELPGRPILYDVTPLFRRQSGWQMNGIKQEEGVGEDEGTTAENHESSGSGFAPES